MATSRGEKEPLIIVILGCTGTGKSKLSLEIGRRVGGELISADSMQVYKGLDIITNKVTAEERAIVPHHLLDFVDASDKFTVVEFKTIALDAISDILARQKIPIIVGGTNYYIESLLWENLIDERNEEDGKIWSKSREVENEDDRARETNSESTRAVYESFQGDKDGGEMRSKSRKVENEERSESLEHQNEEADDAWSEKMSDCDEIEDHDTTKQRSMDDKIQDAAIVDSQLKKNPGRIFVPDERRYNNLKNGKQKSTDLRQEFADSENVEQRMNYRNQHDNAGCVEKKDRKQEPQETEVDSFTRTCVEKEPTHAECQELGKVEVDSVRNTLLEQEAMHPEGLSSDASPRASGDTMLHISLHEQLAKIDSAMAQKLHPNDARKIKRSLQVFEQSGITHSEHIAQQQSQKGSSEYSGPMRFKNVCVLWIQCEFEILDKRLDARVDQMIEQGLVKELVDFYNSWKSESTNSKMENNEGIFQSIGFKEFREFLKDGNAKVEKDPEMFARCVEAMKCATRRYARKQVRWVNNRFLGRPSTSSPGVYGLDATDLGQWERNVLEKALAIVKSFTTGEKVASVPLERILSSAAAKHLNHTCKACNGRIIIGDQNWTAHLRSRSHRHYKKKQQKFEKENE